MKKEKIIAIIKWLFTPVPEVYDFEYTPNWSCGSYFPYWW